MNEQPYDSPTLSKQPSKHEQVHVMEAKYKLDELINELNDKLLEHYKVKEQALLNKYKQELIDQQKALNDLKNTTNEEQIRNKMIERKTQLEKERNQLIQTNMFFSKKCEEYKQTYNKLIQQSNDLEKELEFLNQQMKNAEMKKLALIDQVESHSGRIDGPVFTIQKNKNIAQGSLQKTQNMSTLEKTKSSSVRKISKSLNFKIFKKKQQENTTKASKRINVDVKTLEKTPLQKLFEQSVQQIRHKKKRTIPTIKGEEFTDFEKRAIMQCFLSREQVKRKIYQIIFNEKTKNEEHSQRPEKVKLNFDQFTL